MNIEATKKRILEESQEAILQDYQGIRDKADELIAYVFECIENNQYREGVSSRFRVPIPDIDTSFLSVLDKSDAISTIVLIAECGLGKHFFIESDYYRRSYVSWTEKRRFNIDLKYSYNFNLIFLSHDMSNIFFLYRSVYKGLTSVYPLDIHKEVLLSIDDKDYFLDTIEKYLCKDEQKELQSKEKEKESEDLCEPKEQNGEKESKEPKEEKEQTEQSIPNHEQYGSLGGILFLSVIITIIAFIIGAKFV